MTEIEIRDPDPEEPTSGTSSSTSSEDETDVSESPYRSLLVPLLVVPSLIVMVLVGIFALFGAIAGEPPSPQENIDTLLNGGRNERDQAAFALMRQVLEEVGANPEGDAGSWDIEPDLAASVRGAWEELAAQELESDDDVPITLALTVLVAKLGDPEAVSMLADLTRLSEGVDPDGEGRFLAAAALGGLNADGQLSEESQRVARGALVNLLSVPDPGLRQAAAIGLQSLPGEETLTALGELLADRSVELRLQAAISLADLGDSRGAGVLFEMIQRAPYEDERARDRQKWSKEARISESRLQALRGLVALGRIPDRETLRRLADDDQDAAMRERALELLQSEG